MSLFVVLYRNIRCSLCPLPFTTSLRESHSNIYYVETRNQMIGIYTRLVVTGVSHLKSQWDFVASRFERHPVSFMPLIIGKSSELPITIFVFLTNPVPTAISLLRTRLNIFLAEEVGLGYVSESLLTFHVEQAA